MSSQYPEWIQAEIDEANNWGTAAAPAPSPTNPTNPKPKKPASGTAQPWTKDSKSAFAIMADTLRNYGLEALVPRLQELITEGITEQAQLTLALQDTTTWKQRFAGNEMLRQKGLPVLSVNEYLATERSMAQIMRNFGLPSGFYDKPEDFAQWIGKAVSPAELQERVQGYADIANRQDAAITEQLRAMGMTQGDLLAYTMDADRAAPLIKRKFQTTLIGAAARRAGAPTSNGYATRLAGMGITEQQAQAGYAMISEALPDAERLGDIYGQEFGQRDLESEVFEGSGEATRKRKRLASQERASFSGQSGVAQGSLRRSTSGQY